MIIVMSRRATEAQLDTVINRIEALGLRAMRSVGEDRSVIGVIGADAYTHNTALEHLDGVEEVVRITKPFKLASREFEPRDTVVDVAGVPIGGEDVVVMAGPCSVESEDVLLETAHFVAAHGARMLRGGAFKPRTSPYSFQGLGLAGLKMLAAAREATGLRVVSEVLTPGDVELVARYVDMLQIGTRNMQNYALLREVGRGRTPVLLKRGMSSTIEEWLLAAEYILSHGNRDVVLCERGIRTFEPATRFTLDLSSVALVQELSHLPVVVDPSQATGRWSLVTSMSKAAIAAGAKGLLIEVHPRPSEALSDGAQSLDLPHFGRLARELERMVEATARQPA
jgi:3-deoxy-7-phosphoheptulonate synthase